MHSTNLTFGKKKDGTPNAIFDQLGRVVCSFPEIHPDHTRGNDCRKGSPYTARTMAANACLFTAAPELLSALQEIAAHQFHPNTAPHARVQDLKILALAAIAKATA